MHDRHGIQGTNRRKGKENWHQTIPNYNIRATKKKDAKTIQMMLWHHNYHHCSQSYALSKYDGEANTLTCTRHVSTTFYLYKNKNTPGAKQ